MSEDSGEKSEKENNLSQIPENGTVEEILDTVETQLSEVEASLLNARDIFTASWLGRIQEKDESIEGGLPDSENTVIHVHGWRNSAERGKTNTEDMREAYIGSNYSVAGLIWPSDNTWWNAKKLADMTGHRLADYLVEYSEENPEASIRLQAHSLGCRVISETVRSLHLRNEASPVDEVLLLGGAVHCKEVRKNGRYGEAFEESVEDVWSVFFEEDTVLKWLGFYERTQLIGIGRTGGELPENLTEIDFDVGHHRGYYREDVMRGILSRIGKEI